jgi:hypothetical protein
MKKFILLFIFLSFTITAEAQTAPTLYNQTGDVVNAFDSETQALRPGWYYDEAGSPRYYYANGVYYNPASQSYGGSVMYPAAEGPQSIVFTPGVPNTGVGRSAIYAWFSLIISGVIGVAGANYFTRKSS